MQNNNEKVFKSMHSQTLVTLMQGVLEMVNFSIMSRILTKEDFGYFALLTAVIVVLSSLTEAGIGSAVIQKKNLDQTYINTSFSISLGLGSLFSIILFMGADAFSLLMTGNGTLALAFRIMSVSLMLQGYNNIYNALKIRQLEFFKLGMYRVSSMFIAYCIGIILALKGYGFYAIVITDITNHLIYTIILHLNSRKINLKIRFDSSKFKDIFQFGGLLTITVIIRNITEQTDRFLVGRLLGVNSVGILNRPGGFVNTISSKINGIFDTILFPILSSMQDSSEKIKIAFNKSVALVLFSSVVLCSFVILGSKFIIDIFFGSQWQSIYKLLWIFGLILIFSGVNRICDCFFRSLAIMKSYLFVRVINCIGLISLVYFGCLYGILGVAFAKLFAEALSVGVKITILEHHIQCGYNSILKYIFNNCFGIFSLSAVCFLLMTLIPYGNLIFIFIYIAILLLIAFIKPFFFGELFVENIYNRYLIPIKSKFKKNDKAIS